MSDLLYVRADWVRNQCCPRPASLTPRHRASVGSYVCRAFDRYRERILFGLLDDHMLDDIGVDVQRVERIRLRERALRRLSLIANGGAI